MLILVVVLTLAIRSTVEKGRREYGASAARYAKDLGKAHPNWTKEKAQRRARRMARGYWWDQVRRGFPDTKAAYAEARELAEAERLEAERDGLRRRKEIRERMAQAIEEAETLRKKEWEAYRAGDPQTPNPPYWGDGKRRRRRPKNTASPPSAPPTAAPAPKSDEPSPRPSPAVDWPEGLILVVNSKTRQPIDQQTGAWHWKGTVYTAEDVRRRIDLIRQNPDLVYDVRDSKGRSVRDQFDTTRPAPNPDPRSASAPEAKPVDPERPSDTDPPDDDPGSGAKPAPGDRKVVPIGRSATTRPASATTTKGEATVTTMTGEVNGYEQIVASYNADVERLEEAAAACESRLATHQDEIEALEDADTAYERRIAGLRNLDVDDDTIGDVARLREQNEINLNVARETHEKLSAAAETNRTHLAAAREARDNLIARHGAVKETREATGARGDNALYG